MPAYCLLMFLISIFSVFFFFTHTPPTETYTLSLHDALPISVTDRGWQAGDGLQRIEQDRERAADTFEVAAFMVRDHQDRKSTRLNSSHLGISYAVFCLKKKKKKKKVDSDRNEYNTIRSNTHA